MPMFNLPKLISCLVMASVLFVMPTMNPSARSASAAYAQTMDDIVDDPGPWLEYVYGTPTAGVYQHFHLVIIINDNKSDPVVKDFWEPGALPSGYHSIGKTNIDQTQTITKFGVKFKIHITGWDETFVKNK